MTEGFRVGSRLASDPLSGGRSAPMTILWSMLPEGDSTAGLRDKLDA